MEIAAELPELIDQLATVASIQEELAQDRAKIEDLLTRGHEILMDQDESISATVGQKLANLKEDWADFELFCEHKLSLLNEAKLTQVCCISLKSGYGKYNVTCFIQIQLSKQM